MRGMNKYLWWGSMAVILGLTSFALGCSLFGGDDDDDDDDDEDESNCDPSNEVYETAGNACAKFQECYPTDFEISYPSGMDQCVGELQGDAAAGIYCWEVCCVNISCSGYDSCINACAY